MKRCSVCGVYKNLAEFYKSEDKPLAACILCIAARQAVYYQENRKKKLATVRARVEKDPARIAAYRRGYRLKSRYNMTVEQFDSLLKEQNGKCGICSTDKPGGRWNTFHVDHNHNTGVVRGLLCHLCNRHLGVIEERLPAIIAYLNKGTT